MRMISAVVMMICVCLCHVSVLYANETVLGKVVEVTSTRLVVRMHDGQKKIVYLTDKTKFMHRQGSGEQSAPPKPRKNDRITASLEGDTAAFVIVEEVPK